MVFLIALGLSVETALFFIVGFVWLRSRGYTVAEAGAVAILLVFIGFSLIHQLDWFAGTLLPGLMLESAALSAVLLSGRRRWSRLSECCLPVGHLLRRERFAGLVIAGVVAVMTALVVAGWVKAVTDPAGFAAADRLGGLPPMGPLRTESLHPLWPLNAAALFFHTVRWGLTPDACGFGILAYLAVGLSVYGLVRRYAWPPMALTVTLMVLSMPRLVFLGLHPSAELIAAAAVAVSVLLLYRLVEQHQAEDLRLFVLCLLFSIHANPMSIALVGVMSLLLAIVMVRRHGWLLCRELLVAHPKPTVLVLLIGMGLAQIPVFTLNLTHGHPLFGAAISFDTDGILGAAANLIRFLFVSVDFTEPFRRLLVWLVGLDLKPLIMGVYNTLVVSLFGSSGVSVPFMPVFSGHGMMGFGPVAPLLVLPSMVYAALRGPRRLKAVSVAWAGFVYLAALVLAWTPDNLSVLTPLFAANGFVVAFALPPWRLRRRGMRLLQVIFACLLAGTLAWNQWGEGLPVMPAWIAP